MGLLIFFLIWYQIACRNNPRTYKYMENKLGKAIVIIVIVSIFFSSTFPAFLLESILGVIFLGAFLGAPLFILWVFLRAIGVIKDKRTDSIRSNADRMHYEQTMAERQYKAGSAKKSRGGSLSGLTMAYPKRRKIVERFNKKYHLNLTPEEIDRIVDASYMSFSWEREVYDMSQEYDIVYQWYNRDTAWLRVYLKVFPIQSVSSDFERQREICLGVFTQVFTEVNGASFATIEEYVEAINRKYMTSFDEMTFMIAYRFLQANKVYIDLPASRAIKGESDLEKLMHKYDAGGQVSYNSKEEQYRRQM